MKVNFRSILSKTPYKAVGAIPSCVTAQVKEVNRNGRDAFHNREKFE